MAGMLISIVSEMAFATINVVIFTTRLIMHFSLLWRNFRFVGYSFHNDIFLIKQYLSSTQTEAKISAQKETE